MDAALPERRRGYPTYRRPGIVPARPAEPRYVTSRGFRIAYDDVGSGPPVLLVHGVTLSGGDWWDTGAVDLLLRDGFRALVVDPLGHGQSDGPPDLPAYRYPDLAFDLAAVLDAAGVDAAAIWGYSRGAVLAATLASERPERVARLVVGGSAGMEHQAPPELPDWQQGLLAGDWGAFWSSDFGSEYTADERRHAELVMDARALGAAFAGRRAFRYELRLGVVRCPTLLYEGGDDSPEEAAATAAALATEARILPGLDHNTAVIAAERVWEVVGPFLREWAASG